MCKTKLFSTLILALILSGCNLTVTPSEGGTVTSDDNLINCGDICKASYETTTEVSLSVTADPDYRFVRWEGVCTGTAECTFQMGQRSGHKTVAAIFYPLNDSDNDGVSNEHDQFPNDPTEIADFDGDGIGDNADPTPMGDPVEPWTTYQGNAGHTGYVAENIDIEDVAHKWSLPLLTASVTQGSAADEYVFLTEGGTLRTINARNGEILWSKKLISLNPPSYSNGKVYVQTGGHDNAHLWAFDAATGELIFTSSFDDQWGKFYAPTIVDETVYMAGGSYGGMYALNANTGEHVWWRQLSQYDSFTPAVNGTYTIAYTDQLTVVNKDTGRFAFSILDPNFRWSGYNINLAPVLGSNENVVVINGGRLLNFDLDQKNISWELSERFGGHPSVKDGVIYARNSGVIEARSEIDGSLIKRYSAESTRGDMLITQGLLFAMDSSQVIGIDLSTGEKVWSYPIASPNSLFISEGALYIVAQDSLVALNIDGDHDQDGLPDWWEKKIGSNIHTFMDQDEDGLMAAEEYAAGTNPIVGDTDGDGLLDGNEIQLHFTSPTTTDTDGDELSDFEEVTQHFTDPNDTDSDDDKIHDGKEIQVGLEPLNTADANLDYDNDGFSNRHEALANTQLTKSWSKPVFGDWAMLQGNPKHNGYQPLLLDEQQFTLRWSTNVDGWVGKSIALGDGKLFTSVSESLVALDSGTGRRLWKHSRVGRIGGGASFANDLVYTHLGGYGVEKKGLLAFNPNTGEMIFNAAHGAAYDVFSAPTIFNKSAFINNGTHGGLVAFNAITGSNSWTLRGGISSKSYQYMEPAVNKDNIFVVASNKLYFVDLADGSIQHEIKAPFPIPLQTPVLGSRNNVLTVGRSIISWDISGRAVEWQTSRGGSDYTNLAVGNGQIYALNANDLTVFDEVSGDLLWRWSPPGDTLESNIVVTASHVFVSSKDKTYGIDLVEKEQVWSYQKGGSLSVDQGGALIIARGAEVTAIELEGDTDQDGIFQWWERRYGGDIDPEGDMDNDGLTNLEEYNAGTSPLKPDTDDDGLSDKDEVLVYLTDPLNMDSDEDGLSDIEELHTHFSDPLSVFSDSDELDDYTEVVNGLNPADGNDAGLDFDGDSYSNFYEIFAGTDIRDEEVVPKAVDWGMVQGNASHQGYQPVLLDESDFSLRWEASFDYDVNPLALGDGKVFVTSSEHNVPVPLTAINAFTGEAEWTFDFGKLSSVSSPSFANNTVYVHSGGHGFTAFWAFDPESGEKRFRSPHSAQWPRYLAPTIYAEYAYMNGGYYGGMVSFDALEGGDFWSTTKTDRDYDWEPAVNADYVFHPFGGDIVARDKMTGDELFRMGDFDSSDTFVIGSRNNVLAVGHQLSSYDVSSREMQWTQPQDGLRGLPAVSYGIVYYIGNNTLYAVNEKSGKQLWSWENSRDKLSSNLVVTISHVFVATSTRTYAISTSTHELVWEYDAGGSLSMGIDGALYIVHENTVTAINVGGDADDDGLPDQWEHYFALNFMDASDAVLDLDGDGLNNLEEFNNGTYVNRSDSDADGINDYDEIYVYGTNPSKEDTDQDGLSDGDEILVFFTDVDLADTDGDGLSDGNEVNIYDTDPLDINDAPLVLTPFSQSFEEGWSGWHEPSISDNSWGVDSTFSSDGTLSLRSGSVGYRQSSIVELVGLFSESTLKFDTKVSAEYCCGFLNVFLDGAMIYSHINTSRWQSYSYPISPGEHSIRWEYRRLGTVATGLDAAWIDNVVIE